MITAAQKPMWFFRFKVYSKSCKPFNVGHVCSGSHEEAFELVRKTWLGKWKLIPNGYAQI